MVHMLWSYIDGNKKIKYALCASFTTLIAAVLCMIQPLYSGDIDNYGLSLVVNKTFAGVSQDGYLIFIHPALCKVMECVHVIFPMADCFSLLGEVCILLSVWWIVYFGNLKLQLLWGKVIGLIILFVFIIENDLFHDNFTRWAVFLCMVGMLTILVNTISYSRKYFCIGCIFFLLGGLWRPIITLIYIPFWAVVIACYILHRKDKRKFVVTLVKQSMVLWGLVLCLFASKELVDTSEKYSYAREYNDARSVMVDYPIRDYYNVRDRLNNVTYNDYYSIQGWQLLDTDWVTAEKMKEIGDVSATLVYEINAQNVHMILYLMKLMILENRHLWILFILNILVSAVAFWDGKWHQRIGLALLAIGSLLLMGIMVEQGRAIERSIYPIFYTWFVGIIGIVADIHISEKKIINKICIGILGAVSVIMLFRTIPDIHVKMGQSVWNVYDKTDAGLDTVSTDEIYIWGCGEWVHNFAAPYMEKGKLIPISVMQSNITEGNWFYGQVYFEQYLEQIGVSNPMQLLLDGSAIYVNDSNEPMLTYVREHYGNQWDAINTGEINGVSVWKFRIEE